MDSSDSLIRFDNNGQCDHCNTFYSKILPHWNYGEDSSLKLEKLIEEIIKDGKGKDFNCIIGISGGIDSSYLAYIVKEKFGLSPLVFHVDAGWNSQIAVNNIEKLIDGLNLDLFTEVIDWEEMKDLQLAFFKSGVSHIDVPQDHAFFANMYKFASKHKVKYILTGGNFSTECVRNPLEWMYYQSDSFQLKDIHKKFGQIPLKNYPVTNILWHKIYLPYFRKIKVYRPLDFVQYDKEEAMKFLEKKYEYQKYPQKHFESRFTKFYESFWLPERFSYDTRKVQFSSLILTKQMSREKALKKLQLPSYDKSTISHDIEFIANKLDITEDELISYLTIPKKTYKDYKSQDYVYNLGAKFSRLMGLEKGGKR
tara:strand:- start:1305 stop:2405 length:1101 start_codon:yes stop_codon:yes gene_type:complete